MVAVYQEFNYVTFEYTYTDENNNPIDLTGYTSVDLLLKSPSDSTARSPISGSVIGSPTAGQVQCANVSTIDVPGKWKAQFRVNFPSSEPLYGTIQSFSVTANLDD